MSTGVIIVLVLVAVFVVALVLARPALQSNATGLRRRFGPEYVRAVSRHDGDTKAAQKELSERLRRYGDLPSQPLPEEARSQYVAQWAGIQEQFVDSPAKAVAEADQLLGRLALDRGYPEDGHEARIDALSVHHAHHVDGYRQVHAAARRAQEGRVETEELREALVSARALLEQMVSAHPQDAGVRGGRPSHVPAQSRGRAPGQGAKIGAMSGRLRRRWTNKRTHPSARTNTATGTGTGTGTETGTETDMGPGTGTSTSTSTGAGTTKI